MGARCFSPRAEQLVILADPGEQPVDPLGGRDLRGPAEQPPGLADVGDEDALVAGPPVGEGRVERPAEGAVERGDQLEQAQRVRRPAADVEDLARTASIRSRPRS